MADIDTAPQGLDDYVNSLKAAPVNQPTVDNSQPVQISPQPEQQPTDEPEGLNDYVNQIKYGTVGQQLKTAAEGAAQGVVGPLAPALEQAAGVNPEDIRLRAQVNPGIHYGSEIAGLVLPAIVSGGESAAARAGLESFTVGGVAKGAEGVTGDLIGKLLPNATDTLAGKIGVGAAKGFVGNALIAGSDEASRMILQDPDQSAETALQTIGLAGAIGGVFGGAVPLWSATAGKKMGQMIADIKGRIADHVAASDPVQAITGELNAYMNEVDKIGSEVYGANGLKAQAIEKLVPELHEGMTAQVSKISEDLDSAASKLEARGDSNAALLRDKAEQFSQAANSDKPSDLFNAIQTLKQGLQEDSRYTEGVSPLSERPYRNAVKSLAHDLRESLENREVWGKAADVQQSINSAFSDYLKATKDFRNLMTNKVMDKPEINPAKVETYLKQLGKAQAEIKATKLQNYLDAGDTLKNAVSNTYEKLGLESPIVHTPLNNTLATFQPKTLGSKVADAFLQKMSGPGVGGAVGGLLGHMVGHGGLGTIVGAQTLGPFFSSVLPGIMKAFVTKDTSAIGAKSAIDYASAVAKGVDLLNKGAKAVFKANTAVMPEYLVPSERDRNKIEKNLQEIQNNPLGYMNRDSRLANYLPEHSSAMSQISSNALTYLNSLKTDQGKKNPLDSTPVVSPAQKADFKNALNIAQQPMIVLQKIKDGTLTTRDLQHLNAMYPKLYANMQSKLMEEMTSAVSKGQIIPYKTRIGLSMFTQQALDSTMTPQALMATQQQAPMRQIAQQQQAAIQSKGVKSSPALQKMPSMYQTPGQAGEARRAKDK